MAVHPVHFVHLGHILRHLVSEKLNLRLITSKRSLRHARMFCSGYTCNLLYIVCSWHIFYSFWFDITICAKRRPYMSIAQRISNRPDTIADLNSNCGFAGAASSGACLLCASGTYSSDSINSACLLCASGTFSTKLGL